MLSETTVPFPSPEESLKYVNGSALTRLMEKGEDLMEFLLPLGNDNDRKANHPPSGICLSRKWSLCGLGAFQN